jgi:hypothetical protein
MRWTRYAAAFLLAFGWAAGVHAEETAAPVIRYRDDRLSVRLEKVPLEDVLDEIARATGAEVRGAPRDLHDVTATFDDVPLPEAIHRLLGDQNFMLRYAEPDRLRTIQLFGGVQQAREAGDGSPAAGSAHGRSPAAGSSMPQSLLAAMSALERHAPVRVSGSLASAIGSDSATFPQLFDAAMHQGDAEVRNEAFRVSLSAFETEPDLRSTVLAALGGTDEAALGQVLRGIAGPRAEELANQIASEAKTAELRTKALSVLHRLRSIQAAD